MTYLLIIFIIVLALAPLIQVVPSKYQRRIARLREFAALQGLFVEFRSIPEGTLTVAESSGHQRGKTIYYGLRLSPGAREPVRAAWVNSEQGWRSLPRGGSVPRLLSDLPPGVFAASVDELSGGIYWQEAGEEQDIMQIYQVLKGLVGGEFS